MKTKQHEKLISVIIPAYNVADYIGETIDSVLAQTIGFRENIEIIIIDDGSSDATEEICRQFANDCPENIFYFKQKNSGVSAARNNGKRRARGKYISFLDSDDKISPNFYAELVKFLEQNPEIPFAVGRVRLFEARKAWHFLDYRFTNTRIIDLNETPEMIHPLLGGTVYVAKKIRKIFFDQTMTHIEDAKFNDSVLLVNGKNSGEYEYGVVREAIYYYRKRAQEKSASNNAKEKKTYYNSLKKYFAFASQPKNKSQKFMQYQILYRVGWDITTRNKPKILTAREWSQYKNLLKNLIRELDLDVILRGAKNNNTQQKLAFLKIKLGGKKPSAKILREYSELFETFAKNMNAGIRLINLQDGKIVIDAIIGVALEMMGAKLKIKFNNREISYQKSALKSYVFDENILSGAHVHFAIPAQESGEIKFVLESKFFAHVDLRIVYTWQSRLSNRKYDYRLIGRKFLLLPGYEKKSLRIETFRLRRIWKREIMFFLQNFLVKDYGLKRQKWQTLVVEFWRILTLFNLRFRESHAWIFSDRTISGADNSGVLFEYVSEKKLKNVHAYYAIEKNTKYFRELKRKKYRVIKYGSWRHLYLAMNAEFLLPSHMDFIYLFPKEKLWRKYSGLMQYDVIHTQHGIVLNDMSGYIGKLNKNASMILSACEWERNNILRGDDYGYDACEIVLTGLPRYDKLVDNSQNEKIISICPTWRTWLAGASELGHRAKNDDFRESDYYQFWQKLINDEKILRALKKSGYKIKFYIHPNHIANRTDFSAPAELVGIPQFPYDYNQIFAESALFVTDYSNTLFDFAYLRKPILHLQFDQEIFSEKHGSIKERLFDYNKQGFGPVCQNYREAVEKIVEFLQKEDKTISPKYKKRIDRFFTFSDQKNCQRAFSAIQKYQKRRKI